MSGAHGLSDKKFAMPLFSAAHGSYIIDHSMQDPC